MAKFKVSVCYQGSVDLVVEADDEEQAKGSAILAFEDVSQAELEWNICDVSAESAYEIDEEDE